MTLRLIWPMPHVRAICKRKVQELGAQELAVQELAVQELEAQELAPAR